MRRRPNLAILARIVAVVLIVETGMIWVCSRRVWSPLQCHYLAAFFWSSLPVLTPKTVEVRLVWKARRHRKPELASEDDIMASDSGTGMMLSPLARHVGWTRLTLGPLQRVPASILRPALADLAYNGESFQGFLLLPELWGMAVFCFAVVGWIWFRWCCRAVMAELAWYRRSVRWRELMASLLAECAGAAREARRRIAGLHRSAPRRIETPPTAMTTAAAPAEPQRRSAAFALPLFGVFNGTGEGYLWHEKDEID